MEIGLPKIDRDTYDQVTGLPRLIKYATERRLDWIISAADEMARNPDSLYRQQVVQWLREAEGMMPVGFSCIVLRLHRGRESACFGFMYQKKGETIYVCSGPTFDSMDGEYRHHFCRWHQIPIMHNHWIKELTPLVRYLRGQLNRGEIHITHYSLPNGGPTHYSPEDAFLLLVATYVGAIFYKVLHLTPAHMSTRFIEVSQIHSDPFYANFWQGLHSAAMYRMAAYISRVFINPPQMPKVRVELGQKLVLVTRRAAEQAGSLAHRVWRELHFCRQVSGLVVNHISPSFALFVGWILFPGVIEEMMDNEVQRSRISQSENIKQLSAEIEALRARTYTLDPIRKKEIFVNALMEGMSDAMQVPLDFAEGFLILAKECSCMILEHLGRTFGNLKSYTLVPEFSQMSGDLLTSTESFAHYLFEYIYALYAMNTKLNLVHTDLHLNNITLFVRSFTRYHKDVFKMRKYIIYDVHGQMFIFRQHFFTSGIIDFSRSVSLQKGTDAWGMDDARYRIIQAWEAVVPDFFHEHENQIRAALFEHPELVFKLFSAVDTFRLARAMLDYFEQELPVPESYLELLRRVLDIAKNYLTQQPLLLFSHQSEAIEALEWPNLTVLRNCFEPYRLELFNAPKDFNLVDYYSLDNEIRYTNENPSPLIPTTDAMVDAALEELRSRYPSRAAILQEVRTGQKKKPAKRA